MSKSLIVGFVAVCLLAATHARAEDLEHKAVLNVTVITPEGQPNDTRAYQVKDIDECWEIAKAWVQPADLDKHENAVGLGAFCGLIKKPSMGN